MIMDKNKHLAYRLRSLDKLLGDDYKELERQTIYFSPFSELNDPMEGSSDMVWFGDSVVWENLFRHYLLCMEHKVRMATLYKSEDSEMFFKDHFPIYVSEMELPTDLYRQHFDVIKERFFSYEPVSALIEYLGKRKLPIRKNQLSTILSLISDFALESILFAYDKSKFPSQPIWTSLQEVVAKNGQLDVIMRIIRLSESISEEKINSLLMINDVAIQQLNLIQYAKLGEAMKTINWFYFRSIFLQEYLEQLPQLVYPKWYSASFMTDFPDNSVLWGHYGDSHKGVCLIFKTATDANQQTPHLILNCLKGHESEYIKPTIFPLKNIIYSNEKKLEVEFFKRLWTQSSRIVAKEWYCVKDGRKSPFISELNPTEEVRLAYWDKLSRIQTTKTKKWEYENESRILLDNSFCSYADSQSRTMEYDFKELEGLIFGIKTPVYEKAKIIRIIAEKCRAYKRDDFKFYQARYSDTNNIIISDELPLLKFEV